MELEMTSFYLQGVAKLFERDEPVSRKEFVQKVDMDEGTPDQVKRFLHQIEFSEAYITPDGEIVIDFSQSDSYSDA